MYPYAEKIAG